MAESAYGKDSRAPKEKTLVGADVTRFAKKLGDQSKTMQEKADARAKETYSAYSFFRRRPNRVSPTDNSEADAQDTDEADGELSSAVIGVARTELLRERARVRALSEKKERISVRTSEKKKMDGPGFWMIVGIAFMKDLLDPIMSILQFLFATSGTSLLAGAYVGDKFGATAGGIAAGAVKIIEWIPGVNFLIDTADSIMGIAVWFFAFMLGLFFSFIIFFYLFYNNVSLTLRKVSVFISLFIIGFVPLLSLLPETITILFVIRWLERRGQNKDATKHVLTA